MATSVIEICNNALQDLGEDRITSLTDGSLAARLCNQRWPEVRDSVLRAHPWNCAMELVSLAPLATAPAWKWSHQYQAPADCLRVVTVADSAGNVIKDWEMASRRIMVDESGGINIAYVRREEDPTVYDALLSGTMSARLQAELAFPITGSTSAREAAWTLYQNKVAEARGMDAREGASETPYTSTWLIAKLGGTRLGTVETE